MDTSVDQKSSLPKNESLRDFFLVSLLLFTSGTEVYMQSATKYLLLVFFVVVVMWVLFSDRKINNGFALYAIIFTSFLFIIHIYTNGSMSIVSMAGTVIELLVAYCILALVRSNLVITYIKIITVLAAISLVGYAIDVLHLFEGVIRHLPRVGNDDLYNGIFYVFQPYGPGRNASIFFEPGAYQAFLNAALFMLFFSDIKLRQTTLWLRVSIILAALLTTFSTTGALIFAALFFLIITKSTVVSWRAKLVLMGLLFTIVIVFATQFRYVIIEKIEKFSAIEDVTDSGDRRSFDLLVDLEVFKRHIFGVGQKRYYEEFGAVGHIEEGAASSNGISSTLAIYGLPFTVFLFGSFFAIFKKHYIGALMVLVPFGMLILFLFSEGYYTLTPISMSLIAANFVSESSA
jgi:hypothetical protein